MENLKRLGQEFKKGLLKLASKPNAWMAGFEAGEEDCSLNQWGSYSPS